MVLNCDSLESANHPQYRTQTLFLRKPRFVWRISEGLTEVFLNELSDVFSRESKSDCGRHTLNFQKKKASSSRRRDLGKKLQTRPIMDESLT